MYISAFAKKTYQHKAILLFAFIDKHTIAGLMFTIHVAVSNAGTLHQLNLLIVIMGLYTIVQTRTCTNIHVIACAGQKITLFLSIHS